MVVQVFFQEYKTLFFILLLEPAVIILNFDLNYYFIIKKVCFEVKEAQDLLKGYQN